jgi:hypothetical protein
MPLLNLGHIYNTKGGFPFFDPFWAHVALKVPKGGNMVNDLFFKRDTPKTQNLFLKGAEKVVKSSTKLKAKNFDSQYKSGKTEFFHRIYVNKIFCESEYFCESESFSCVSEYFVVGVKKSVWE